MLFLLSNNTLVCPVCDQGGNVIYKTNQCITGLINQGLLKTKDK